MVELDSNNHYKIWVYVYQFGNDCQKEMIKYQMKRLKLTFCELLDSNAHELYHLWNKGKCCQCNHTDKIPDGISIREDQYFSLFQKDNTARLSGHTRTQHAVKCCNYAKIDVSLDDLDLSLTHTLLMHCCRELLWYCCFTFKTKTLQELLDENKHDIIHMRNSHKPCRLCSNGISPKAKGSITKDDWNLLFVNTSYDEDLTLFSAKQGITIKDLNPWLSYSLLQVFSDEVQMIKHLRKVRNDIAHRSFLTIDAIEFKQMWSEIEAILLHLSNVYSGSQDFKRRLLQSKIGKCDLDRRDSVLEDMKREVSQICHAFFRQEQIDYNSFGLVLYGIDPSKGQKLAIEMKEIKAKLNSIDSDVRYLKEHQSTKEADNNLVKRVDTISNKVMECLNLLQQISESISLNEIKGRELKLREEVHVNDSKVNLSKALEFIPDINIISAFYLIVEYDMDAFSGLVEMQQCVTDLVPDAYLQNEVFQDIMQYPRVIFYKIDGNSTVDSIYLQSKRNLETVMSHELINTPKKCGVMVCFLDAESGHLTDMDIKGIHKLREELPDILIDKTLFVVTEKSNSGSSRNFHTLSYELGKAIGVEISDMTDRIFMDKDKDKCERMSFYFKNQLLEKSEHVYRNMQSIKLKIQKAERLIQSVSFPTTLRSILLSGPMEYNLLCVLRLAAKHFKWCGESFTRNKFTVTDVTNKIALFAWEQLEKEIAQAIFERYTNDFPFCNYDLFPGTPTHVVKEEFVILTLFEMLLHSSKWVKSAVIILFSGTGINSESFRKDIADRMYYQIKQNRDKIISELINKFQIDTILKYTKIKSSISRSESDIRRFLREKRKKMQKKQHQD